MTKDIYLRKAAITTSGELVTSVTYADSATYSDHKSTSSVFTSDNLVVTYEPQGLVVKASTPSSRKQERLAHINERLHKLSK